MAAYETIPLREHAQGGDGKEEPFDYYEEADSSTGCGCFRLFRVHSRQDSENEDGEESWLVKRLKKVKQFSELVAGPKWKTFIRRIGAYYNGKKKQRQRFQYDEQSYALNFDGGGDGEVDDLPPAFSARFAAPVANGRRQSEL